MLSTYTDWTIRLDADAVMRGQGLDPEAVRARSPRIVAAAEKAIEEGRGLLAPLVLAREYAVTAHEPDRVVLEGGELPCGPDIAARLAPADRLFVVGATVGEPIDDFAIESFERDPMLGLALHGVGGAAVEDISEQACRFFSRLGQEEGAACAILCWPGSAEWPNSDAQRQIFELLGPEEAGGAIELTATKLIRPAKSITFVVGLSDQPVAADTACDTCGLIPTCSYRGC